MNIGKIDKYEFIIDEEILSSDQSRIEQAKLTYSPLGKVFEKQTKVIEEQRRNQIEAIEEHRKQLVKSGSEKESLALLKQKDIFEELAKGRIDEIQDLSKQIDFNNLVYYFKGEIGLKMLPVLKFQQLFIEI